MLRSDSIREWNWLMHRTNLYKSRLIEIYGALYYLIGDACTMGYNPILQFECPCGPGSVFTDSAI